MGFEFRLSYPSEFGFSRLAAEPLEDRGQYEYLVMRACGVLSEIGCTFHIAGFGSADWRFDVEYDMSTLVEQLPELLDGLASDGYGEVDFYSQGVERSVAFEWVGGGFEVRCRSRALWCPNSEVEFVDAARMEGMLIGLMTKFSSALAEAGSEIAALEPFPAWRDGRRRVF